MASIPRGGRELAHRIALLHDELQMLARAAQAARETDLSNTFRILARRLTDTSCVRKYLNHNLNIKEQ